MLFNSFEFLIFFPAVVLGYYVIPHKFRYLWLLAASYYFYMGWNPAYALLLLFSTTVTYASGLCIEFFRSGSRDSEKARRMCVAASFVLNLSVLFLFKYFDFAVSAVRAALRGFGLQVPGLSTGLLLPVGISFYTFQALSYTMDVYRGEIGAEKNFFRYALFVSFFPQLVAGPIERSKNLLRQLSQRHAFVWERARKGLLYMLWGFFLKLVIADRIALFVNAVYGDYEHYPGIFIEAATVCFAFQIYCDFAGYSTIALGAALVLGFRLTENFNAPYLAHTPADFWRRWHISLTGWFRDYLYIPLGGSRKGKAVRMRNVMIVFLISGLWHGAAWHFVLWGGLNGVYQVIGSLRKRDRRKGGPLKNLSGILTTFLLVDFSWLFFRAASVRDAMRMLWRIVNPRMFWTAGNAGPLPLGMEAWQFAAAAFAALVLIAADLLKARGIPVWERLEEQKAWVRIPAYLFLFWSVLMFGLYGVDYEASQFIYFQF